MKIRLHTSRYTNPSLRSWQGVKLGFTRYDPKSYMTMHFGYTFHNLRVLAPSAGLLSTTKNGTADWAAFRAAYLRELDRIPVDDIRAMIERAAMKLLGWEENHSHAGVDVVLLCWEDIRIPDTHCHREAFAGWWQAKTGEVVSELDDYSTPKGKKTTKREKEIAAAVAEGQQNFLEGGM